MEKQSIGEIIYDETKKRLDRMEQDDYEFPKPIGKVDWVVIIGAIIICLFLIIMCMLGVIE